MTEKKSGRRKTKSGFRLVVIDLRRITGVVCLAFLVCAAFFGFAGTRRALHGFGNQSASLSEQGDQEAFSDGDNSDFFPYFYDEEDEEEFYSQSYQDEESNPPDNALTSAARSSESADTGGKFTLAAKKTTSSTAKKSNCVRITATPVNIRSGVGRKYSIVARTKKGAVYKLLATKKDSYKKNWHQIELKNGKNGWVLSSRCTPVYDSSFDSQSTTAAAKNTASTAKKTTATTATAVKSSVEITATPVNIRSGAGTDKDVILRASKGNVFELLSVEKGSDKREWCRVALDGGRTGWVLKSFCRVTDGSSDKTGKTTKKTTPPTTATAVKSSVEITVTPVNIRSGAGTDKDVILRASKGNVFELLSVEKGSDKREWCRVALDGGRTGWVLKSFCRVIDGVSDKTGKTTKTTKTTTTAAVSADDALLKSLQPKNHDAKYFIVVYKGSQSVVVYGKDKNGDYTKQAKIFTCSTGKESSPTCTGSYHIRAKYRWRSLVGGVYGQYSSSISKDYLFHSVPYEKKDASTLEDKEYSKLGKPASKGCVRLCVRDSKWIYDKCGIGTQVRIVDDSGPEGPGVPSQKKAGKYSGWDPSDKWSKDNPYFS